MFFFSFQSEQLMVSAVFGKRNIAQVRVKIEKWSECDLEKKISVFHRKTNPGAGVFSKSLTLC